MNRYLSIGALVIGTLLVASSTLSSEAAASESATQTEQIFESTAKKLSKKKPTKQKAPAKKASTTNKSTAPSKSVNPSKTTAPAKNSTYDKAETVRENVVVKKKVEPIPTTPVELTRTFEAVEQPASFPGGQGQLMAWLSNHLRYPEEAQKNGTQGKVIVKFVVEKDGSITNAQVVRSVSADLDAEALRVMKQMPKWNPGKNNGTTVRSYFVLPFNFKLQND